MIETNRGRKKRFAVFFCCVCMIGVCIYPPACLCSSGIFARGARAAGLGGVRTVGGNSSPFAIAARPRAGFLLQVSWANLYGVSGLDVGSVGMRCGWTRASSAASVGLLQTPTPFQEIHLTGCVSVEAAEGLVVGGGAALASLRDGKGDFANEPSVALGLALTGSRRLEIGCVAETPVDLAGAGGTPGRGSGQAAFVWGLGLPVVNGVGFVLEEERRGGWVSRRFGGEIRWPGVLAVRAGISDSPFTVSLGVGVYREKTTLDVALVQHEVLGVTPHASISYRTLRSDTDDGPSKQ